MVIYKWGPISTPGYKNNAFETRSPCKLGLSWFGWIYVDPAPDHYRCLTCYLPKTRSEVIADTVKFIRRYIPIPETSLDDHVKKTADD